MLKFTDKGGGLGQYAEMLKSLETGLGGGGPGLHFCIISRNVEIRNVYTLQVEISVWGEKSYSSAK